jgi:hypothetical protein
MIYAQSSTSFEALVEGFPTGLVGTLGVRVVNPATGAVLTARTTSGITETVAGSGLYGVTLTAPSSAGEYAVVWDTSGSTPVFASEDLFVTLGPPPWVPSSATPTLDQVAAINLARTDDGHGDTAGMFNATTRPTDTAATALNAIATDQVADTLGATIDSRFFSRAQGAAALYAAALVESTASAPREALMKLWTDMADARVEKLAVEIEQVGAGDQEGPSDDEVMPVYAFPVVCPLPEVF